MKTLALEVLPAQFLEETRVVELVDALRGSGSRNDLRQLAVRSSESNKGADQQVQGNRWVTCFHLGDTRLTRLKFCGEVQL